VADEMATGEKVSQLVGQAGTEFQLDQFLSTRRVGIIETGNEQFFCFLFNKVPISTQSTQRLCYEGTLMYLLPHMHITLLLYAKCFYALQD
jgi:hypothetical protein